MEVLGGLGRFLGGFGFWLFPGGFGINNHPNIHAFLSTLIL